MLTKKEWCVVVMAVCLAGLGGVAVVLAGCWLWLNSPKLVVGAVCGLLMAAQCVMWWRVLRRRPSRQELWSCRECGMLGTQDKILAHRCQERGRP
jgi:membrane protein implicated in regulation of membrane protease activity